MVLAATPRNRRITIVVVAVVAVVALLLALYVRGGGPLPGGLGFLDGRVQDPLAASGPAETVLRTLRLAGYERVSVGDEDALALVRLAVPRVDTSADVELAWQVAAGSLAVAYPEAGTYVVQVFEGTRGLVEVEWDGDAARAAVDSDDPQALSSAANVTFLTTEADDE